MSWLRRLKRELSTFSNPHVHEIRLCEEKPDTVIFRLVGPPLTPYAGYIFNLVVTITSDYPLRAPSLKFVPPILHPSVDEKGQICKDSLDWSCEKTLSMLVSTIATAMADLRARDTSLNTSLASLLSTDIEAAKLQITQHVAKNAEKHAPI